MVNSLRKIYNNKELFLLIQVWLYLIALTFSFGSTESAARQGIAAYLLQPSPYIKLSANAIPILTLIHLYRKSQVPLEVGKLFINRNFYFLWFVIYNVIMLPASANPKFSLIRIGVYTIQLLPLISIIIQSQIYFGRQAMAYVSLSMTKFTGLLFFIPLYSFIQIPEKVARLDLRFVICGGLLHPVLYTSLLFVVTFALLSFPSNTSEHLLKQFRKWRIFAICLIGVHVFIAMSRGPILGFLLGSGAFFTYKYMSKNGLNLEFILLVLLGSLSFLVILSLITTDIIPLQSILRGMMREEVKGDIGIKELTTGRTDIWVYVYEHATPFTSLFGNGFGLMDQDDKWLDQDNEMHLQGAHNGYLMAFAMSGFIGFSLILLYFFQCILLIIKSKNYAESKQTGLYIMLFVYYAIDSLSTSNIGAGLTINTAFFLLFFSLPVIPKGRTRISFSEDRNHEYSESGKHSNRL